MPLSIVFMMIKIYPTVGIIVIANYEMIYTASLGYSDVCLVNADILRGPAMIAILQKHLLLQIKYYRIVLLGSDKRHSQRPHKFELCPRGLE